MFCITCFDSEQGLLRVLFVERSSTIERYRHPPQNLETIVIYIHARAISLVTPAPRVRVISPAAPICAGAILQVTSSQAYKFTSLKLRSTTEQMPALVSTCPNMVNSSSRSLLTSLSVWKALLTSRGFGSWGRFDETVFGRNLRMALQKVNYRYL
jgi:hypothetical protein